MAMIYRDALRPKLQPMSMPTYLGAYLQKAQPLLNIPDPQETTKSGGIQWKHRYIDVLSIRFSQNQIHPFFFNKIRIVDTLDEV